MNLFFLSCDLPIYIYTETYDILGIQYVGTYGFVFLNYLTFFYSSLNFFVYFSCNKLFRAYVSSIICFCRKNNKNDVVNTNNISLPTPQSMNLAASVNTNYNL